MRSQQLVKQVISCREVTKGPGVQSMVNQHCAVVPTSGVLFGLPAFTPPVAPPTWSPKGVGKVVRRQ